MQANKRSVKATAAETLNFNQVLDKERQTGETKGLAQNCSMILLIKLWGLVPPNATLQTATNSFAVRRSNSFFYLQTSVYLSRYQTWWTEKPAV